MPIIAKNNGVQRDPVPAGMHVARCYSIVEIGTVTQEIKGTLKSLYKIQITWELPNIKKVFTPEKGEQPLVISEDYNLSMYGQSNLRKMIESWRGKGFTDDEANKFDVSTLIGVPCMVNIINKPSADGQKVYSDITGVMRMPKEIVAPHQCNKSVILCYDNFDTALFESLPLFLKAKIMATPEYAAMINKAAGSVHGVTPMPPAPRPEDITEPIDDLPF
jgi:hypothetical protein